MNRSGPFKGKVTLIAVSGIGLNSAQLEFSVTPGERTTAHPQSNAPISVTEAHRNSGLMGLALAASMARFSAIFQAPRAKGAGTRATRYQGTHHCRPAPEFPGMARSA